MKQRWEKAKVLIKSQLCAHSNENSIVDSFNTGQKVR